MEYTLKRQRYWVLLSANNRPVLSSLIARERRPKKGEWVEVNLALCCKASVEITQNPENLVSVTVFSNGLKVADFNVPTFTSIQAIADYLNQEYPGFGKWSSEGNKLMLSSSLYPGLSITYTVTNPGS